MKVGNPLRKFPQSVIDALGTYVYALCDPRDKKVFYVGKGTGSRVFDHFTDPQNVKHSSLSEERYSSKIRRIREVWNERLDVDWLIIRRRIRALAGDKNSDASAEEIEAAIIDALAQSQNGPPLNDQRGKQSAVNGMRTSAEVLALGATPINPKAQYPYVFVFPIQRGLEEGRSPYEATRRAWNKSPYMQPGAIAVGLAGGVSQAVFKTNKWEQTKRRSQKWMFEGDELGDSELLHQNWTAVTGAAGGFWGFGGYLVVEFDGDGRFRLLRGTKDKRSFFELKAD